MQQYFHKEIELSEHAVCWLEDEKSCALTYLELNQAIYQRARYFNETIQIKKGDVVGVLATRSPEYVINLFALWHIGAVYLPLSDTQTTEYIVQRLEKSGAHCLLTVLSCYEKRSSDLSVWVKKSNKHYYCIDDASSQHALSKFSTKPYLSILELENKTDVNLSPACIFSSSGTTGEPKLIEIPFDSFSDRVKTEIIAWNFPNKVAQTGVLGFIDFGFDASVNEILLATMTGNTLYIVPQTVHVQIHQGIPHFLKRFEGKIRAAILLPSVLKGLHPEDCRDLIYLLTMGEKCLLDDLKAKHWFDFATILNGYGPTETTFGASVTVLNEEDPEPGIQNSMIGLTLYLMEIFEIDFCENQSIAIEYAQQQPNIFFLYSSDDLRWRFYVFDYSSVLYHGELCREHNTLCQFLRGPQSSEYHKINSREYVAQSRQQLLNILLQQSIQHPRYIFKFQHYHELNANPVFSMLIHAENLPWPIQGEIYISGTGLGRYLNNEQKNREKFLTVEEAEKCGLEKNRVFKSGDIAEYRHATLIYRNRNDRQIKRYGMLVNLDDIEDLLRQCPVIDNATVIYHESPGADPIVVAFFVPTNLTMVETYSDLLNTTQEIFMFLDDRKTIERKYRPNCCFFVNRIPITHRSKASYQLADYAACNPVRLIKQDTLKFSHENEMLSKIADIWQSLLEGNLSQLLRLETKNTILYPLDCTFTELGGDSLLMSLMTQKIWELHSRKKTPAPNDFSHAILHNSTISGIQQVLICYGHQAIKKRNTQTQGLPLFIFEGGLSVNDYPLYECCLPENFIESYRKIFITILKNQCRQVQAAGSYHIISTNHHLKIAILLAKDLAAVSDSTYLTILQHEASETSDLLKHTTTNLHITCVNADTLLPHIHQCQHARTQALINERLRHLFDEFIKPSFSLSSAAGCGWLTSATHGQTCWLLGNAGTGKSTSLRHLIKHEGIRGQVLPLKISGLKQQPLFETALSLIFPRWQWNVLAEQSLDIVIDDYDAMARFDCPNLWQQAHEAGFSSIRWLISCRLSYWELHQNTICKFATNLMREFRIVAPPLSDKAAEIISQVGLPMAVAAYELIQDVKEKTSLNFESIEYRYHCLMLWFKREYARQSPEITESDYLQQVFETFSLLYRYYGKENDHVSINLRKSHWQDQKKLPCVHALPGFSALLPLISSQIKETRIKLPFGFKHDADEYLKFYQQSQARDQVQSVSDTDIRMLQTKWHDHFWDALNSKQARYHVLPLQYVANSTPIFIFHPMTGETPVAYRRLAEALGSHQTVIALQMWVGDKHSTSEEKARLYYDYILRLQSKGPYVLIGWSFGATVAYRVAILLETNGYKVDWVINLDSAPPEYFSHQDLDNRVLDMIRVLAHTAYKVPLDNSVLQISVSDTLSEFARSEMYFKKAITYVKSLESAERYKNFCHAMEKACINLRVYIDFARWCNEAKPVLKAKYWVFEALQSDTGRLNGVDFKHWASYCEEGLFYHDKVDANHFSLFDIEVFKKLRTKLYCYQARVFLPLSVRLAQYREKRQQLFKEENRQPAKGIYIPVIASYDQEGQHIFLLEEQAIVNFLNNEGLPKEANCFLIQGDPGSGKSHYQKQLEQGLFNSAQYFPIFISLKPGNKDCLRAALLTAGFTEEEYQATKQQLQEKQHQKNIIHNLFGAPLLVIFDGYDEALTKENLYRCEQLDLWQAKALISCRTCAVNWQTMREQFGDTQGCVQTAYIQPFRKEDIRSYLKQYEHQTGRVLTFESWEERPNFSLIQNPLLLSIAVELWEELSTYRNRAELYQNFFNKLSNLDLEKIKRNEGVRAIVALDEAFIGYNQYQAYQYWRYSVTKDSRLLKSLESIPNNYDTYQARQGSRLGIHEDGRLTHITFWEYYFSSFIIKVVLAHNFSDLDTAYPPLLGEASLAENISLLKFIFEIAQVMPWMQFDLFRHHLLLIIYASRYKHSNKTIDSAKVIAATNAISILTVMQMPFSGLDLRKIRVPGAYLKGAIFDMTCLRGADLSDAKMHDVLLRYTDLTEANLENVDFGQLRKLMCGGRIEHLCFNPSDKNQLAVGLENTIEIWNIKYRKLLWIFKEHTSTVSCIGYSPNGDFLVSGSEDHIIRIWNLKTGIQKVERRRHTKEIRCVAFNPSRQNFISGGDDGVLYFWILSDETPQKEIRLPFDNNSNGLCILSAAFSPDGKMLALGCSNYLVYLLDSEQGTLHLKLDLSKVWMWTHVNGVLFSSDNKKLIMSGMDSICIWNLETNQNKILKGPQDGVRKLVTSCSGIVTSGHDEICLWDIDKDIQRLKLRGTIQNISSLACCPEGKLLASASHAGELHFWNLDQLIEKEKRKGHKGGVIAIAFSPDGQNLASSGDDKKIRVWDLGKNIQKIILKGHSDRVTDLCYSFNGNELASCSARGTILIWDVVRGVQKAKLMPELPSGGMWHIVYSRCGNYIFSGDPKGKIYKWDIAAGKHIVELIGHTKQINKLVCSSDEKLLISASGDKTIRIWDIERHTQKAILQGHTDYINSVAYSLDETSIVSGGMDETLRFWNIKQGSQIAKVKGNAGSIYSLAYVPSSKNIFAESGGDTISFWDLNNRKLISKLQNGYSVGNLDFNSFGVLAVSGSCNWTGPFCGRDTVVQWSPVPSSPWPHYQIISIYSKTPALYLEHLLLEETFFSHDNEYLLKENKSALAKLLWPPPETLKQPFKTIINCRNEIPFNLPRDILHHHIINQLPQSIWNVFACLNHQYYNYFGLLKNLAETLVAQAIPVPHHYSQRWFFERKREGFEFEFVDAYNIKHCLWWPAWFIENLIPLRLKSHASEKINELKKEENKPFCFNFNASTTRRLVYQLSLTYLLSTTLCIFLDLGLNYCIRDKPVSLYHIFDLLFNARTEYKKNYLKRIIEFLSNYGLFVYDKENEMISWGDLGLGLLNFSDENNAEKLTLFNLKNEKKARGTRIKSEVNGANLLIKSSPTGIVSTLIHMKKFSKILSNAASLRLFDAVAKGSNTRQALLENYPKLIDTLDDYLRILKQYHFLGYSEENNSYHLTVLSEYLRSDHPETLQPTIAMLDNIWWEVISMKFYRALIFDHDYSEFIHFCNANLCRSSEKIVTFNKGISCLNDNQDEMVSKQLPQAVCEIIKYNSVVDIAGGEGQFLKIFQKQYPNFIHIALYEQTSVVSKIQSKGGDEIKKLELISGNFFDPPHNNNIPKNRELYFIKDTLHDFDDSECLKILSHIRVAIPNKSKLCVIERTLYNAGKPTINDYADLLKMMLFMGRERYAHEWLSLFYQAGFFWENEENPIVVEDHTIMVCKPTYPEIPRWLGFFTRKKSFQQSNSVDFILRQIGQRENDLIYIDRDTFISQKNIIDNFQLMGSYSDDYLRLLCLAINPDPQNWLTHCAVKSSELYSMNVRKLEDTFSFLLLPIFLEENHMADLESESDGHWVGLIIDYFRKIIFYLDPLKKPVPSIIYNYFIKNNEQLRNLTIIQDLSKSILNTQSENSDVYFVAMISKIISEIQANNHIAENPVHLFENLEHIMMVDVENHLVNLKKQHLRWATHYLEEVNPKKYDSCLTSS